MTRARADGALRIAMIGQKGVPATYGGIERHVEELGARLAERGHLVTAYARTTYREQAVTGHRGMRVRVLPTIGTKHLDAIVHSGLSTVDALRRGTDIVHYHAIGPGLVAPIPRYGSRAKVVLTVHGRDALRSKWGPVARGVLTTAEWMSARVPDATVVVSRDLREHYAQAYGTTAWYIPNGVVAPTIRSAETIADRWGLAPRSYLLFVGRIVPEKAPDLLIKAFRRIPGDVRLVVAGGSSHTDGFLRETEALTRSDPRVLMPGYVYGETLDELYSNAAAFVLPSALEGLPLTLLEAISYGVPIVASDIPPHLEVLGSDAPGRRLFRNGSEDDLVAALGRTLADTQAEIDGVGSLRRETLAHYDWDAATDALERLYRELVRAR
jgi:glycosyltransferase involved in cell wall biosynthesis